MEKKRRRTTTSAFGTPGRENHDSAPFYAGRLYQGQPQEQTVNFMENPVPAECLDSILCRSAENMSDLPDNSIHLMVTSPPYNVGKEYDADLTMPEYLAFLDQRMGRGIPGVGSGRAGMCEYRQPGAQTLYSPARLDHREHAAPGIFNARRDHLE